MGKIIGNIGRNSTDGEKVVYRRLLEIYTGDPDVYVYYEPLIGQEKPDFVLFGPDFGIVIIEVKDYDERLLCAVPPNGPWYKNNGNGEEPLNNPFDQVYQYWRTIIDRLGIKEITRIVVLSQVSEKSDRGLHIKTHKPARVELFFKEDIARVNTFQKRLKSTIPSGLDIQVDRMKLFRGNLIPTCRLPTYRQTRLFENTVYEFDELELMDKEQEKIAHNLSAGHRLFFGVAGSGKTVILIARARYLALKNKERRILVLCYNKNLAKSIMRKLNPQDYEADIIVINYHKWAKDIIYGAGNPYDLEYTKQLENYKAKGQMDEFFSKRVPELLDKVVEENSIPKYDAILIDEAQDFEASWFKPVVKLLNPETDSLLITCDGLQGIYARKKFYWKDVGVQAVGRVHRLTKSYRNPEKIGKMAKLVLPQDLLEKIQTDDEILPTEQFARKGGLVEVELLESREKEYEYMVEKIKEFEEKSMSIIVVFRRNMEKIHYKHPFFDQLVEKGINWVDLNEWGQRTMGILVGTLHGTKGLEADAVFIPELDMYHTPEDRQLLYVGMTRALKCLILTSAASTKFVKFLHKVHDRL
ncbi:MAG: 3'-5' exonuclease [Candidatus Hodarchaeota archaeon]